MSEPWDDWDEQAKRITVDTADKSIDECIAIIANAIHGKLIHAT